VFERTRPELRIYYSELLTLPLPEGHRFPMAKYRMLRDSLLREGVLSADQILPSPLAPPEALHVAHAPSYVRSVVDGSVDSKIMKRIGFPWSEALVRRSLATVGGCLAAARRSLTHQISGQLAGGTHHAHFDAGEGYCVFNDIAVACRTLLFENAIKRPAIVDLDVHQGNGNSSILGQDKNVFILSLHGEKNYPFRKVPSSLDIPLPDQCDDELFLRELDRGLGAVEEFKPDMIFYQAGVDPLYADRLGKLSLSFAGLIERDRRVMRYAQERRIPLCISMGGGYAEPIELTVEAHVNTYKTLREVYRC
jgi:acetoin utilization deacetylase AcuC-like enzyme